MKEIKKIKRFWSKEGKSLRKISVETTLHTLTSNPVIARDLVVQNSKVPEFKPYDIDMSNYDSLLRGGDKVC